MINVHCSNLNMLGAISCRAVNALTARQESFAARKARVFKRAVFNLAAYIDNNRGSTVHVEYI